MAAEPARARVQKEISLRGTLTGEGTECQAMRGSDGRLYTLTGNLKGYNVGDKVVVAGVRVEVSTCQQGTTIAVRRIQHPETQGDEPTARLDGEVLQLAGVLTGDGAECQAFRSFRGELFTLTGALDGFKTGDPVELTASVVHGSPCQEDGRRTLQIKTIKRARKRS